MFDVSLVSLRSVNKAVLLLHPACGSDLQYAGDWDFDGDLGSKVAANRTKRFKLKMRKMPRHIFNDHIFVLL